MEALPSRPLFALPTEAAAGEGARIFGEGARNRTAPVTVGASRTGGRAGTRLRADKRIDPGALRAPGSDKPWFERHVPEAALAGRDVTYLRPASLLYSISRAVMSPIIRLIYRVKVGGMANLPEKGGALLIPNHPSYVDVVLLAYVAKRPIRFLMYRGYYEASASSWYTRPLAWLARAFFQRMGAIPVAEGDSRKALQRAFLEARWALKRGELVAIFPEGHVTRTGNLQKFKRGFEEIARELGAPVIPAHLDGLWGSIFSFRAGPSLVSALTSLKAWWNAAKSLPRRVYVRFGAPLAKVSVDTAREAVQLLSAENLRQRLMGLPTLGRQFLRTAKKHWSRRAVADSTGKDLSYGKTLTASILLAGLLRGTLASENVGVLLPPSAGGALANIALEILGKVPVNLNYTASEEAMISAIRQSQMAGILTSKVFVKKLNEKTGFLDKMRAAGFPVEEQFVFLEDLLPQVPKWKLTLTYLALRVMPRWLIERLFFRAAARSMDADAAIIFTSGSSGEPKGVELTHGNIRANIEMLREVYPLDPKDAVLGVLPFFHVFGFTVTLWMALLSGMSAVYHTHPLETEAIARLAEKHPPTVLLGTPTFLMRYVQKVPKEAFAQVRLVIAGAEKLREASAAAFKEKFGVAPLEGYGATELSPVVAVNVPDVGRYVGTKPGTVGNALPGLAIRVADPNTLEPVTETAKDGSREGMLLVKGPSVMKGYLGKPEKTAEVIKDGWYVTGDIVRMDRDGFITIVGRQSRFSKIAGEMISHGAVEEKLQQAAGRSEMVFFVGGVPDEDPNGKGEKLVVLYAGWDGSVEELLAKAREAGLKPLWTPRKENFHKVEAIPVLGTGKLDLKAASELVKKLSGGKA